MDTHSFAGVSEADPPLRSQGGRAGAVWGQCVWEPTEAPTHCLAPLQPSARVSQGQGTAGLTLLSAGSGAVWLAVRTHTGCATGPSGSGLICTKTSGREGRHSDTTSTPLGRGGRQPQGSPLFCSCLRQHKTSWALPVQGGDCGSWPITRFPLTWLWEAKGEMFGGKQICSVSVAALGAVRALPPQHIYTAESWHLKRQRASPLYSTQVGDRLE